MAPKFKPRALTRELVDAAESIAAATPRNGEELMRSGGRVKIADPAASPALYQTPAVASPSAPVGTVPTPAEALKPLQVGQVHEVPLGKLRPNPLNPRAIYTATAVDEMAMSLAAQGQATAATGYLDDDGFVVLIEGHTRQKAAHALDWKTLRVELKERPASDQALYEEARASNAVREDQSLIDDAIRAKELLSKGVYKTQQELAKVMGLDESQMSRLMSLNKLPSRILNEAAEDRQLRRSLRTLAAVQSFYAEQGDDETLRLLLDIQKQGLGFRQVDARRKAASRGPVARPRSNKSAVSFKGAKGELRVFGKEGRVEFSLKGLSEDDAAELQQRLEQLLSGVGQGSD